MMLVLSWKLDVIHLRISFLHLLSLQISYGWWDVDGQLIGLFFCLLFKWACELIFIFGAM